MTSTSNLVAPVAAELGDGWTVITNPHGHRDEPYLVRGYGPDAPRVAVGRWGGRLSLTGVYPSGRRVPDALERQHVEISVADTRPPAAMAGEIRRRLLPDYLANLAAVVAYDDRCLAEDQTRAQAAEQLAGVIPGGYVQELPPQWGKRTVHRVIAHPDGAGSVTVELDPDGRTAKLEARSLPVGLVEELLARLAGRLL